MSSARWTGSTSKATNSPPICPDNGGASSGAGGDLIVDAAGSTWLVATVLENWTDWTKLGLVLQSPGVKIGRHGMILDLSIPAESSTVGAMRG
jgi:hypothetical protein